MLKKWYYYWGITIIFLIILITQITGHKNAYCKNPDTIIFTISWVPYAKYAGFFSSMKFYENEDLNVKIVDSLGDNSALQKIINGDAHIGSISLDQMIIARNNGADIIAIGVWQNKIPNVIFTLKKSDILKPKDLEGKTIVGSSDMSKTALFPAFAKASDIDISDIEWDDTDITDRFYALLSKKVDAVIGTQFELPTFSELANKNNQEISMISYSDSDPDSDLDIYSEGFVVRNDYLKKHEDLVKRFMKATIMGLKWSIENKDEAVNIFLKHHSYFSLATSKWQWQITADNTSPPTGGIGYIYQDKMERTIKAVEESYGIKIDLPVTSFYTNDYLPEIK